LDALELDTFGGERKFRNLTCQGEPAYGTDFWGRQLVELLVAAQSVDQWYLAFHMSAQAQKATPKKGEIRCEEYLATFARGVAGTQIV
jgi:hypothetical protein